MNVIVYIAASILKENGIVDLGISNQFHSLGGMIVSFLLVSRVNTALSRYGACRGHINVMYRETREFIQTAFILSQRNDNDENEAREWRNEIAYRALVLLRTSVAVVEYFSKEIPGWKCPELSGFELLYATPCDLWKRNSLNNNPEDDYTNTLRVPFRMAYLLRQSVSEQEGRLKNPFHVTQENLLYGTVNSFMGGYYGMRKFITTPVPFPLIQMTRTLVIIYIYTIPLIFVESNENTPLWECLFVFLLAYGFMGLELVAIELDDPFGNDDNDFDTLSFAQMVFEDTFLMVAEVDGEEWSVKLQNKMNSRRRRDVNESFKNDFPCINENSPLL